MGKIAKCTITNVSMFLSCDPLVDLFGSSDSHVIIHVLCDLFPGGGDN